MAEDENVETDLETNAEEDSSSSSTSPIPEVSPSESTTKPETTHSGKKPYVCSICDNYFESKAKKTARHTCGVEFKGQTGYGIPAKGHPEFEAKPEATPGDIELTIEEDDKILGSIPFAGEPEEKPIKAPKAKPAKRRTAKADKERVGSMVAAVGALLSTEDLGAETEAAIIVDLVSDSVSLSVEAAEVRVNGLIWLGLCASIAAGFYVKRTIMKKKKAQMEALNKSGKHSDSGEEQW